MIGVFLERRGPSLVFGSDLFFLLTVLTTVFQESPRAAITDEMLRLAPVGEWLSYGRDNSETHYSPLSQVDTSNVRQLQVQWSAELPGWPGKLEATPIVAHGLMFVTGTWSAIFAIDVRTGKIKWSWDPAIVQGGLQQGGPVMCCGPVNRGVAVYDDKVYLGLLDGRLVALRVQTGEVVWVRQTTPPGGHYSITGAPRIVRGLVIIGNSGADFGVRGYVSAYDAITGLQVWRFYTVPGDPSLGFETSAVAAAARTWTGQWWLYGGGGTVWDGMAFDADADLLYVGVGNGSPWNREVRSPLGGDNLYLASIVALRPRTGALVWYYQVNPGESWDYTATQNIVLADLLIDGENRKVLMQAPKNGFFYVLDRLTGKLISAAPFAHVTWAVGIDAVTGRPLESGFARYGSSGAWISPAPLGAHAWQPMSYNPKTGLVYIPGQNSVGYFRTDTSFLFQRGSTNTGAIVSRPSTPPPVVPGPPSFLVAWNPKSQREVWRLPLNTMNNGGTLTTGGGLVFIAQSSGKIAAVDAVTGQGLWEHVVGTGPATPITYEVDGKQYVSILAGRGSNFSDAGKVWTFALPR